MENKFNKKSSSKDSGKHKKIYTKTDEVDTRKDSSANTISKRVVRRNQLIIGMLTVLLGIAGYINFSGSIVDLSDDKIGEDSGEDAFAQTDIENIDISLDETSDKITVADLNLDDEDIELNSDESSIGEAVLTSADSMTHNFANMKLNREQTRSKSKEFYLEIINGDDVDETAVQSATDAYMKLTDNMEKETEAETILSAKGFSGAIVSIGEDNVDVVLSAKELSDTDRAKVEDIVVRKTGCRVEQINITTVSE